MTPFKPDHIAQHNDVIHSFQATLAFEKIHESTPEAASSFEHSSDCIDTAASFISKAGLPGLDRLVATGENSRLMVFSLNIANAEPPGPRMFGITTKSDARVREISNHVREAL